MTVTTGAPPASATAKQRAALELARRRTALQVSTLARAVVGIDDEVGWARLTELGTRSTVTAQQSATVATTDLLNATLNAADLVGDITSLPGINPGRLASGKDVRGMFAMTRQVVSNRMLGGATFAEGLDASANKLVAIAASEPHRIGRDGQLAVGLSDERFNRYRRVARGVTCKFCLMLATRGAVYLTAASAGEGRKYHAHCVPADTLVRSPGTEAATRRWYEGELVVITTASGKHLRITPNHPVLTDRGWVPAGSLDHGDYVVDGSRLDWQRLDVPDVDDAPALIGDVFESLSMLGRTSRVESSPEDFYGDGRHGQVDVVRPYGLLDDDLVSAFTKHGAEDDLSLGGWLLGTTFGRPLLPSRGAADQSFQGHAGPSDRIVGGLGLTQSVLSSHGRCAYHAGIGAPTNRDAPVAEFEQERRSLHAMASGDGQRGVPGDVLLDSLVWDIPSPRATSPSRVTERFDPATLEPGADRVRVYADRGRKLLDRLAGQVALDRIVYLRRIGFDGHVLDLHTVEGWYSGNDIVVSNCDCSVEAVLDPEAVARARKTSVPFSDLAPDWRNAILDKGRLNAADIRREWANLPDAEVAQAAAQGSREAIAEMARHTAALVDDVPAPTARSIREVVVITRPDAAQLKTLDAEREKLATQRKTYTDRMADARAKQSARKAELSTYPGMTPEEIKNLIRRDYQVRSQQRVINNAIKWDRHLGTKIDAIDKKIADLAFDLDSSPMAAWSVGDPIPIDAAAKGSNPKYATDAKAKVNCTRVVQAVEMRRRGVDVVAKPMETKRGTMLQILEDAWVDNTGNPRRMRTNIAYKTATDEMENWPPGARGIMTGTWSRSGGSHVWNVEKLPDGTITFVEGQDASGAFAPTEYVYRMKPGSLGLLRVDDLWPTQRMVDVLEAAT